jgi:branched-chain amino acid transport system permease protein
MAALHPGSGWAPIPLFGRDWLPTAVATWAVPLGLCGVGGALVFAARRMWQALVDRAEEMQVPSNAASTAQGGAL